MQTDKIQDCAQSVLPHNEAERYWEAVLKRDASADGKFYYSVSTTGVYCRPSCGSRLPCRAHVRFHASCAEAENAGFRPCKRCNPNGPSLIEQYAEKISRACRIIESADVPPSLSTLAQALSMSTYHFHRIFKAVTGVTPRAYGALLRENRLREQLAGGSPVTQAIYDAGFNSNGRFYANSRQTLGMTPTLYQRGAPKITIRFAVGQCSLGAILVAATEKGVCAILLDNDPELLVHDLQRRFPHADLRGGDAEFEKMVSQVVGYVEQPALGLNLPLDLRGTAFQQRVWQALRNIPAGSTVSYTELARRLGAPKAFRAVAQACAANAIAVAIPCHRVVRNDGGLSGYRWGVERKRLLLEREMSK